MACRETPKHQTGHQSAGRARSSRYSLMRENMPASTVRHRGSHRTEQSVRIDPLGGTKFSMRMRGRPETLFMPYTMSNKVIEFEPDRRIAWQPTDFGGLIGGRIWRYELPLPRAARWSARRGTSRRTGSDRCSRWARCPSRPRTACGRHWSGSPPCWSRSFCARLRRLGAAAWRRAASRRSRRLVPVGARGAACRRRCAAAPPRTRPPTARCTSAAALRRQFPWRAGRRSAACAPSWRPRRRPGRLRPRPWRGLGGELRQTRWVRRPVRPARRRARLRP